MDFIFNNLIWLIAAAAGLAQWLTAQREAKKEREEAQRTTPGEDREFREELEAQLGRRSSRPAVPPPIGSPEPAPAVPPPLARSQPASPSAVQRPAQPQPAQKPAQLPATRASKELERQEQLAEKLRLLKEEKASRPSFQELSTRKRTTSSTGSGGSLRQRLTSKTELRTAFVLKEILDKPVALKS